MFWIYCKHDLVNYFNELLNKKVEHSEAQSIAPLWFERMRANRPMLPCIAKEGVLDIWLSEVKQWALDFRVRVPTVLQKWDSDICTAFRNIERMKKPPEHITIA